MAQTLSETITVEGETPEVKYNNFTGSGGYPINIAPGGDVILEWTGFMNTGDVALTVEIVGTTIVTTTTPDDPEEDVTVNFPAQINVSNVNQNQLATVQPGQSAKIEIGLHNNQSMGEDQVSVGVDIDYTVKNPEGTEINPNGTPA